MITKEFLTEQGIDETKHEAIISAFEESKKGFFTGEQLRKEKGDAVRSMMEGFEKSIFEVTNVEKNNNEKASDYATRAFEAFHKTGYEAKITELQNLNNELNDKIKKGIKDPELVAKLDALEQTLNTEREAFKQKETEWQSETAKRDKLTKYNSLIPKLKTDIDADYKKFKVDSMLNELLGKEVVEVDGKLLIKGDETNGFTNIEVEAFMKENLKNIIDEKHTQTGTGLKPAQGGDGTVLDISDNESPQAKEAKIREYLNKQGLNTVSKEYTEQFKSLREKYILKK